MRAAVPVSNRMNRAGHAARAAYGANQNRQRLRDPYAVAAAPATFTGGRNMPIGKVQRKALDWLRERGGDGLFNRHGVLMARGELAPHMRATWNKLIAAGELEKYDGIRVRVVN